MVPMPTDILVHTYLEGRLVIRNKVLVYIPAYARSTPPERVPRARNIRAACCLSERRYRSVAVCKNDEAR